MPNKIVFKNKSGVQIDDSLIENLCGRIERWQQEYRHEDVPACILVRKSSSDSLFKVQYEPALLKRIKNGIESSLLSASIDVGLRDCPQDLIGKIEFVFFIGYSEKKMEKQHDSEKKKGSATGEKARLSVTPIEPKFSLSKVILPAETRTEIESVLVLLKNMQKIYYDWGFIDIDPVPRSIVNLWGPPGTGKTMTVHAIARELGKKILVLNYADIESKYVGDAPKNLVAAFERAEKEDAVIFFDEADSFLGKRITNVDSGSEQAINSLRSQMLMKLEEFNGTVFFATNLHENYDQAFESRILKHIEFKLPNAEARRSIILGMLPPRAPYSADVRGSDDEFNSDLLNSLSELLEGFSGREIKNCVLEALVRSCKDEGKCITAKILTETFTAKKEEKEAIKRKAEERKNRLSGTIKKNLDEKNYNVKTTDSENPDAQSETKTADNEQGKE